MAADGRGGYLAPGLQLRCRRGEGWESGPTSKRKKRYNMEYGVLRAKNGVRSFTLYEAGKKQNNHKIYAIERSGDLGWMWVVLRKKLPCKRQYVSCLLLSMKRYICREYTGYVLIYSMYGVHTCLLYSVYPCVVTWPCIKMEH